MTGMKKLNMRSHKPIRLTWVGMALGLSLGWLFCGCQANKPLGMGSPGSGSGLLTGSGSAEGQDHADIYSQINSSNVQQLVLAWNIELPDTVTHTPLLSDGMVYFADWGGNVYGVNPANGQLLWQTKAEDPVPGKQWRGFVGSGVLGEGKLFEASAEGLVFALDPKTGKLLWQSRFTDRPNTGSRSQLLYNQGMLYIPVSPQIPPSVRLNVTNFQGSLVALRAKDGGVVWEQPIETSRMFELVGANINEGLNLDQENGLLFLTTNTNLSGIPSPFASCIIGLNAKTGQVVWAWQIPSAGPGEPRNPSAPIPGFLTGPQLFTLYSDERGFRVVGAGDSMGRYWVVSLETGTVMWSGSLAGDGPFEGILAEASIGPNQVITWGNTPAGTNQVMNITALNRQNGQPFWVQWQFPGWPLNAGFLSGDIYLAGSVDGRVRAYGVIGGRLVWVSPPTKSVTSSLVVSGGRLYFSGTSPAQTGGPHVEGGVYCFALNPASKPE